MTGSEVDAIVRENLKEAHSQVEELGEGCGKAMFALYNDGESTTISICGDGDAMITGLVVALSDDDDIARLIMKALYMFNSNLSTRETD